ncbi:hypothetical protein [Methanoculleus sp.]|uniref:hypothetical protein n=1 Tax=Methanoculleus sp. TaxID=90427 RepID=UPI002FCB1432
MRQRFENIYLQSAAFAIKTESINPTSGTLEPGQQVVARYVFTYEMSQSIGTTGETADR